ncbi:hypothetical protein AMS68_004974 [Peltaster fructicola]|uniref:GDP/GTP exchange factor Sec2 N-terminal domain-containing protein n=1 Tax=Peltaster fructicola TaxID=286661 RepID=A0A6H0XXF5_9PEZI|nr:hypothetical protein AMS68_004974 [Peltaster fructicola]
MSTDRQSAPAAARMHHAETAERDPYFKSNAGKTEEEEQEQQYILTLETDQPLHKKVTALREKYFPHKINKLSAHLTLFHALPASRLDSDIIPVIESVAERTGVFDVHAGRPFRLSKGIAISVPKHQGGDMSRAVHDALQKPWQEVGFLSPQDAGGVRVHWTIMNKVTDEKRIQKSFDEVESSWEQPWGTAIGLTLWRLIRSISSPGGNDRMASVALPSQSPSTGARDDQVMDTRTPSPLPRSGSTAETAEYKPDLSQEVAMLSTKLVNAINFQTTLDDQLQQTRHELELSQRQFAKLQAEKKYLDDMIRDGLLVRRSEVNPVIESLRAELGAERTAKDAAEKSRKQTEAELETLTSALFEEANKMVAAARKDSEAAEKRNSQLKGKLTDTEVLLASQQEQLQDLKLTMERMSERGDTDTARNSVPSTPIHPPAGLFDGLPMSASQNAAPEVPPEHPLFFASLIIPVLRNDVIAYNDFQDLLLAARRAAAHLRSSSSGLSQGTLDTSGPLGQLSHFSGSSPNLPGAFSFSTNSSPHTSQNFAPLPMPLKDSKFYKRTLVEDIEPTLRLDLAPGLSFLSRRGVLSSLLQGSLIVEPFVPGSKFVGPIYACALCGESRKQEQYQRKHRFKTSDDESAQRYPLCDYCVARLRAAGDFMTFLRMVRDGHWRADTEDEQKNAWEESVRLRERMFWARMGGGVIPAAAIRNMTPSTSAVKSPRQSLESISQTKTNESVLSSRGTMENATPQRHAEPADSAQTSIEPKLADVFQRHKKSMSIARSLQDSEAQSPDVNDIAAHQAPVSNIDTQRPPDDSIDAFTRGADSEAQSTSLTLETATHDGPAPATEQTDHVQMSTGEREAPASIEDLPRASATLSARNSVIPSVTTEPLTSRPHSIAASDRGTGRPTGSVERPPSLASRRTSSSTGASKSPDRKESGVLARVRAMEQQAQSK